jgi:IS4 transposase
VPHQNIVFHSVMQYLSRASFDRLVEAHGSDADNRTLSSWKHFMAMAYAQLSGAPSLRAVEAAMASEAPRLYHLGAAPVARSTLADANRHRPAAFFAALFATTLKQLKPGLRRKLAETVYLIDSTSLHLDSRSASWARFSARVCGAKAHVVYDPDADRPIYAAVTPMRTNDITAAHAMPIEAGATYVFDLGYYDFAWWARLHDAGCRIVTRCKANTPLRIIEERALPPGSPLLGDRVGHLPARQATSRRNPFRAPVREVRVRTDAGKVLRLLTNDLAAPAQEIADLYRRRWAIELFFRWVKQTLRITRFLGTSENAVRIQVAVALIVFLLLRLAQASQAVIESPLAFARLVAQHLMTRRRLNQLLRAPEPPPNPNQLVLTWCKPCAGQ